MVDAALETGQVSVTDLLPDPPPVGRPEVSGYAAFREGVTDTLAILRDEQVTEAESRRQRFALLAVAAALAAASALVAVMPAAGAHARSRARARNPAGPAAA